MSVFIHLVSILFYPRRLLIFLLFTSFKTEFFLIGLNLPKYTTLHLAPPTLLDSSTACTIATAIVHSKLDYCNSLYYKLKSSHITPILRSLHWLRITERIEYKLLSLTYKVLTTTQPPYLHNLISTQRPRSTRSSSVATRPPTSSSPKITDRSFCYASPCPWNQLPLSLRQPHSGTSSSISYTPIPSPITSSSSDSPLCSSITPTLFHFFKTYLFHKSHPRSYFLLPDCVHRLLPRLFLLSYSVFVFSFPYFFVPVPCTRLSWPYRQLLSARKYIAISHRIVYFSEFYSQMRLLPACNWAYLWQ